LSIRRQRAVEAWEIDRPQTASVFCLEKGQQWRRNITDERDIYAIVKLFEDQAVNQSALMR
jgi:hypothetical protein